MGKQIDWYYHRSGCKTCGKMDALLAKQECSAEEVVSANKVKLGKADALELAASVDRILATRGKQTVELRMSEHPDEEVIVKHLIGPTGNLRAPTIRSGKLLLVGFDEHEFAKALA